MDIDHMVETINQCAYNVRVALSTGLLEEVYKRALLIELHDAGLKARPEVPLTVFYKDQPIGNYRADIVVEDKIIIELKVVSQLIKAHEAQLVNYLSITGIDDGLLINFGEIFQIKHKYRIYKPKKHSKEQ